MARCRRLHSCSVHFFWWGTHLGPANAAQLGKQGPSANAWSRHGYRFRGKHENVCAWSITSLSLGKASQISRKLSILSHLSNTSSIFHHSPLQCRWWTGTVSSCRSFATMQLWCTSAHHIPSPGISRCHSAALGPWGAHLASTEPSSHAWLQPRQCPRHWGFRNIGMDQRVKGFKVSRFAGFWCSNQLFVAMFVPLNW